MQTFPKKKLDIIIEAPALTRLLDFLDDAGVTGYTVLPAMAGRGRGGRWRRDGSITDAGRMVQVLCITDAARVDEILEPLFRLVNRQMGIVTISDVEVVRADHF